MKSGIGGIGWIRAIGDSDDGGDDDGGSPPAPGTAPGMNFSIAVNSQYLALLEDI